MPVAVPGPPLRSGGKAGVCPHALLALLSWGLCFWESLWSYVDRGTPCMTPAHQGSFHHPAVESHTDSLAAGRGIVGVPSLATWRLGTQWGLPLTCACILLKIKLLI